MVGKNKYIKKKNYKGKPKRKDYRSQFEFAFAVWLYQNNINFSFESEKLIWHKKITTSICCECSSNKIFQVKKYTPDFFLENGVILELKGKLTPENRTKMISVVKEHPTLDIRMVFYRDNKIKGVKSYDSYSSWAKLNGIKYHVVGDSKKPTIPISWTK